jgi:hypothetical protein
MIDPQAQLKIARLRYMQRLATALLVAMMVLLALSASFKTAYPWLQWVQAFAAAATVGAIADWFAVVALFHHPLGLPIPHTAIVPANKERGSRNAAPQFDAVSRRLAGGAGQHGQGSRRGLLVDSGRAQHARR